MDEPSETNRAIVFILLAAALVGFLNLWTRSHAKEQVEQTTSLFVPAPEQFNHRQTHVSDARLVVSALNGRRSVETTD